MSNEERSLNPHEKAAETKKRRTLAKLVLAATEAIEDDGLDLRLEDVAVRAGVSTSTLYNFFPTKGALFRQVFIDTVIYPLHSYVSTPSNAEQAKLTRRRFVQGIRDCLYGRTDLLRGMLMDRAESPPSRHDASDCIGWIIDYVYECGYAHDGIGAFNTSTMVRVQEVLLRGFIFSMLDQEINEWLSPPDSKDAIARHNALEDMFTNTFEIIAEHPIFTPTYDSIPGLPAPNTNISSA